MSEWWEKALYKEKNGETLEGNYLNSTWKKEHLNIVFDFLEKENLPLNSDSKALEIGCNLAGNLRRFKDKYEGFCVGYDINEEAIEKNSLFFGSDGQFQKADLLNEDVFSAYDDDHFDLGFSTGFLMHLLKDSRKEKLINEFFRVCKRAVICEAYKEGVLHEELSAKRGWHYSYEDCTTYSDKVRYVRKIDKNYHMFYMDKNSK